jgi:hypothetical protein
VTLRAYPCCTAACVQLLERCCLGKLLACGRCSEAAATQLPACLPACLPAEEGRTAGLSLASALLYCMLRSHLYCFLGQPTTRIRNQPTALHCTSLHLSRLNQSVHNPRLPR